MAGLAAPSAHRRRLPPAAALPRLQTTLAPWTPEYAALATRLKALSFPGQSDAGFHIHAMLRLYVEGKPVPVPANVGIDPQGRFIAPLHTHGTSGARDGIVVAYGKPGSFPTKYTPSFAPGL